MTLNTHLISMASRSTGVRADEVHGFENRRVVNALAHLSREGKLHRAKVEHRHVRFFAHIQMRDMFMEEVKLAAYNSRRWRNDGVTPSTGNAPWPADAPIHYPETYTFIECPSHTPRFSEFVLPFVHEGLRCA